MSIDTRFYDISSSAVVKFLVNINFQDALNGKADRGEKLKMSVSDLTLRPGNIIRNYLDYMFRLVRSRLRCWEVVLSSSRPGVSVSATRTLF